MALPIITAHPIQLTFIAACAEVYLQEEDALTGAARRGIAYLIRADRAVTTAKVASHREVGQRLWLRFSGGLRQAVVLACDEEADCTLLSLQPAVLSQVALTLRRSLCQPGDACQTWAAMPTLRSPGQVVQALVEEPLGEDGLRGPAMLLHMVAGGEHLSESLAGSPILHDGFVVGHLRSVVQKGGETFLLCCPAPYIGGLEFLPYVSLPLQPPKASYLPAWYVPRPDEETRALDCLEAPARPLFLYAPERHGKTWFLEHLLASVRARGHFGVRVNLELLPVSARTSLDAFLAELSTRLYRKFESRLKGLPGSPSGSSLAALLELVLQAVAPQRFYLTFDRFDTLRDTMFYDGFVALLAELIERSAQSAATPWPSLRLVLLSATAPDWLVRPMVARPFVAVSQELLDFSSTQLLFLAKLYKLQPTPKELTALQALVGGHPYLCRVAMYAAAVRGETLSDVLYSRGTASAVFDFFLETCQQRLTTQPGLWPTLERVLREQSLHALDRLLLPRLERMGIVRRKDPNGTQPEYTLRYPLYRRLLEL